MTFTDLRFLAVFGGCWVTFLLVPTRARAPVLAAWGLLFYALYAGTFLVVVLALTAIAATAERRWHAYLAGAAILSVLVWFKLAQAKVGTSAVIVPLGLSYLSFELLHVAIERRRGRIAAPSFIDMLAYVFFMPCRIAGPIRRFPEFMAAVENAAPSSDQVYSGILRILTGLAKKLVVADTLALTSAELPFVQTPAQAWAVMLAYSFQILFDFSAYSDLAIGFARLLGIRVPENFSYPYLASNIREFWNRWHITLSQWVRDYLFVPTGRWLFSTPLRPYPAAIAALSYLVTFLAVGAWHGLTAAFLVWGLYHGALLAAHHVIQARMPMVIASSTWYRSWIGTAIGCAVTFLCVTIGWIPFITDLDRTGQLLRLMLLGAK